MKVTLLGDLWLIDASEIEILDIGNTDSSLYVANLETPIYTGDASHRPKWGPALKGSSGTLSQIRKSFDKLCLTLANNHTMDYGESGLSETLDTCERLNIVTVGAGTNTRQAHAPAVIEVNGMRIGVLGCCETQFGISTLNRAGVAALDPTIYTSIRKLASEVDIAILSIHGAAELCPWPAPKWQDMLRSFVEAGVKIIHGHHAHVPQGYEAYNDGLIFYGLGNFLVDPECWYDQIHPDTVWSILADCTFDDGELSFLTRTIVVDKSDPNLYLRPSTDIEFQNHSHYLSNCNRPLGNRILLTGLWQEAAVRMYDLFFASGLGFPSPRLKGKLTARGRLSVLRQATNTALSGSSFPSQEKLMALYNFFACENHSDAISTALGVLSGELDDLRTEETRRLADEMMPWSVESLTSMKWPGFP